MTGSAPSILVEFVPPGPPFDVSDCGTPLLPVGDGVPLSMEVFEPPPTAILEGLHCVHYCVSGPLSRQLLLVCTISYPNTFNFIDLRGRNGKLKLIC